MLDLAIELVAVFGLAWAVFTIVFVMPSKSKVAATVEPAAEVEPDDCIDLDYGDSEPETYDFWYLQPPYKVAPKTIAPEPVIRLEVEPQPEPQPLKTFEKMIEGKSRKELIALAAQIGLDLHPKSPRDRVIAKLRAKVG